MPALDKCEGPMIRAIEKDGWQVEEKPFPLRDENRLLWADVKLSKGEETIIIVEIKCFSEPNLDLMSFYSTLGQYRFYRAILEAQESKASLYLAIPLLAYERFMERKTFRHILEYDKIKLIIVDLDSEEIQQWQT
jgi:hypothetical protein